VKWIITAGGLIIVAALVVLLILLRQDSEPVARTVAKPPPVTAKVKSSSGTSSTKTPTLESGPENVPRPSSSAQGPGPRVRGGGKSSLAGRIRWEPSETTARFAPETLIEVRRAIRPAFYKCRTEFPPTKDQDLGKSKARAVFKLEIVASGGVVTSAVTDSEMLGATDSGFLDCVTKAIPELTAPAPTQEDQAGAEWVTHFNL
jgi:hypothetical protein